MPDPFEDDDAEEYELEPIDPEILEMERQRVREQARRAEASIDINEVYDDQQTSDPVTWDDFKGFQFSIRHLLILTAVLAILLTLHVYKSCMGFFILFSIAVAAGWYYVIRREKRELYEKQQRRAASRRHLAAESPEGVDYSEFDQAEQPVAAPEFRFAFSMKELIGAFTVAAFVFAMVQWLGGAEYAALVLGMVALIGLAVNIIGLEVPALLVLCWWLVLVLYVIVSLWAAFGSGGDGAAMAVPIDRVMWC